MHFMKICAHCGRENGDEAGHCGECGTQEFKTPAVDVPDMPPRSAPLKWEFSKLTPEDMKMDLVTLMVCRTLMEADMIVGVLGSADIPAFIPDEFLMQAVSWNLNTFGYVRVQVSPNDFESAKRVLLASPEAAEPSVPPEGGPAPPPGNPGDTGGRPSVS